MKNFFDTVFDKFLKVFLGFKTVILTKIYKNPVCIFNTPIHGNIGDHAIYLAEHKLLSELFPGKKIISIPTTVINRFGNIIKHNIGECDTVFITGGGFLGNLWMSEEELVRKVIELFDDKKIIIFPSTVFFTDDNEGRNELLISKKIYESHNNLHLFLREKFSYEYVKNNFNLKNYYLVPDIVLYLDRMKYEIDEKKIASICLRKDKEKTFDDTNFLENILKKYQYDIHYTTTVIDKRILSFRRCKAMVYNKIQEFHNSSLVVTDRLHGMIFSYLANKPCVVLNSKSYKLLGVYDWIKDNDSIVFANNINSIENVIKTVRYKTLNNNTIDLKNKFSLLTNCILQNDKGDKNG